MVIVNEILPRRTMTIDNINIEDVKDRRMMRHARVNQGLSPQDSFALALFTTERDGGFWIREQIVGNGERARVYAPGRHLFNVLINYGIGSSRRDNDLCIRVIVNYLASGRFIFRYRRMECANR